MGTEEGTGGSGDYFGGSGARSRSRMKRWKKRQKMRHSIEGIQCCYGLPCHFSAAYYAKASNSDLSEMD